MKQTRHSLICINDDDVTAEPAPRVSINSSRVELVPICRLQNVIEALVTQPFRIIMSRAVDGCGACVLLIDQFYDADDAHITLGRGIVFGYETAHLHEH